MKYYLITLLFVLAIFKTFSQTKQATLEWITEKINDYPGNGIACKYTGDGKYCLRTKSCKVFMVGNEFKMKVLTTDRAHHVASTESGYNNFEINLSSPLISNIEIEAVKGHSNGWEGNGYFITIISKKKSNGSAIENLTEGTSVSEVTFVLLLSGEENLPSRMQKAFNNLVNFNKSAEPF